LTAKETGTATRTTRGRCSPTPTGPAATFITADGTVVAHSVRVTDGTVFKYLRQVPDPIAVLPGRRRPVVRVRVDRVEKTNW
jgi:hypothetical protein